MSTQPAKTFFQELVPSENWVYTYLEQPFLEGIWRLRRAVHGFNFQPTTPVKISLCERTIYLLSGSLLVLPPLNFILWIFMKNTLETEPLSQNNPFLEPPPQTPPKD